LGTVEAKYILVQTCNQSYTNIGQKSEGFYFTGLPTWRTSKSRKGPLKLLSLLSLLLKLRLSH